MSHKCRLASYVPKGKGKQAMKQQKAMLIALIVICLTVIVTALVTRKDLCEVRSGVKLPGSYTVWIRVVSVCTVVSLSPSQPYHVTSGLRDSDIHPVRSRSRRQTRFAIRRPSGS